MPYLDPETPGIASLPREFGAELRRCRMTASLSRSLLAQDAGVSQSTISRLERGQASHAAMVKLVLLSAALNRNSPLAFCPHQHDCAWSRLDENGRPVDRLRHTSEDSQALRRMLFPGIHTD